MLLTFKNWNINRINIEQKEGRPKMRRGIKKASKTRLGGMEGVFKDF